MPNLWHAALFLLGAIVMRGAGCALNDIADRDFDAKVERTQSAPYCIRPDFSASRPLCSWLVLSFAGLLVLLQFNWFTVLLGAASLAGRRHLSLHEAHHPLAASCVGSCFQLGRTCGLECHTRHPLSSPPLLLYAGGIVWTLAYDTIYAHQDKEDDVLIGVKSTALLFGADTRPWLMAFFAVSLVLMTTALITIQAGLFSYIGLAAAALHAIWQVTRFQHDNAALCLKLFKSNRTYGASVSHRTFIGLPHTMTTDLLSIADDVVKLALKAGATAADALAISAADKGVSLRHGVIEEFEQAESQDLGLRVFVGQSAAMISGSVLTRDALQRLVDRAIAMAKLAPPDPFAGLAARRTAGDESFLILISCPKPKNRWTN